MSASLMDITSKLTNYLVHLITRRKIPYEFRRSLIHSIEFTINVARMYFAQEYSTEQHK